MYGDRELTINRSEFTVASTMTSKSTGTSTVRRADWLQNDDGVFSMDRSMLQSQ